MKARKTNNLLTWCILAILIYVIIITIFYFAAGEQLYYRNTKNPIESVIGDIATDEITPEFTVKESFLCKMNRVKSFSVQFATFARINNGYVILRLNDETNKNILKEEQLDISNLEDGALTTVVLDKPISGVFGHILSVEILSNDGSKGNAVGPLYSSQINRSGMQLHFNDKPVLGTLCLSVNGDDNVWTGPHYWKIMAIIGILISAYCLLLMWKEKTNRKSLALNIVFISKKYRFLTKQLVSRDFKIKYKRSLLGALWSFVNPLLTMTVQYFVFSTIFKSDIKYYPVYLLSGVVLFGFFQEATGASIWAIVGNSSLITKVYVPKYIYPVSKVLSSSMNLIISLLPLLIMCIVIKVDLTKAWIILPFILICLILFCIGIGFILSAAMVFFRDVQFIWSVISMVWMYVTPIFYPESILPENVSWVLNYNPMYYFISFFRTIIIDGISPEPIAYVKCLAFSLLFLLIGILIFRKSQDKFIFYI